MQENNVKIPQILNLKNFICWINIRTYSQIIDCFIKCGIIALVSQLFDINLKEILQCVLKT